MKRDPRSPRIRYAERPYSRARLYALPTPLMTSQRAFVIAFAFFAGSIVFSLAGAFLLNYAPGQAGVALGVIQERLGLGLDMLIKLPTWVNMVMLAVLALTLYWRELGPARSLAFLAIGCVVGAAAELIGTTTGFPFGPYSYGEFLGAKIAGHVPWLIPPSWYAISIVSLDLARRMHFGRIGRIAMAAVFMVLWDVALDPAMNHAFPFWKYEVGGVFFGMPLVNWFGWFLTSVIIVAGYEALGGLRAAPDAFVRRWAPIFYAVNTLFSVGICFAYRAPLAGLAGLVGLAIALGLVWLRRDAGPAGTSGEASEGARLRRDPARVPAAHA